jgi:hypothetical protein
VSEAATAARHVLVVANETVGGESLIAALRAKGSGLHVTVLSPVNPPRQGYVVYEDSRRASAGRRLDRTLNRLRDAGIAADGFVVEGDAAEAVRDALHQLEPPPTEIVVSTHPHQRSGWLRRNVVDRIRAVAGDTPVEHVVVQPPSGGEANVLVVANETVVGETLLDRIRERARRSPASFLIISPQSDPRQAAHPEAERRLRRALATLRSEGIDAHGQVTHPDPYTATLQVIADERVDEVLVSTFPGQRSGWLRRDLVERLRKDAGVPVEHVVVEPEQAAVAS